MNKPLIAITGASSGIGYEIAKVCAEQGHPLLLMARRVEPMLELGIKNSVCRSVDVRDRKAIVEAVKEAEAKFGPIDMMVANAGLARLANVLRQDPDEWDEMIDINVRGVLNTVRSVMRQMAERKSGSLVIMGSVAGAKCYPDHTVYGATKAFVRSLSASLRETLADSNVRVIHLSPGITETNVLSAVTDEKTLAAYQRGVKWIGGGLDASIIAKHLYIAYSMPQDVNVQEISLAPTRQKF
jgi:NADP-dependent 3-hydroxy acid dehydrogenase YdfG